MDAGKVRKLCLRPHLQPGKSSDLAAKFSNVLESKTGNSNCDAEPLNEAYAHYLLDKVLRAEQSAVQPQTGAVCL